LPDSGIDLNPAGTLVMFTDGVAEAFNADFEEFGQERIVDLVRAEADGPAVTMVEAPVDAARRQAAAGRSPMTSRSSSLAAARSGLDR